MTFASASALVGEEMGAVSSTLQVSLVALGPLTNVAIAMLADPGLGGRLHSLYIMGGNMEGVGNVTTAAEFNFHADPEAAAAVLRLASCPTTIATWELSYKYTFVLYCTVL